MTNWNTPSAMAGGFGETIGVSSPQGLGLVPMVIEQSGRGERAFDIYSRLLNHQPSGGFSGQVSDIERHANYIVRLKKRYNQHMADFTGRSMEEVDKASDRDNFLTAEEAVEFGMVDRVLASSRAETV